jgi:hypothetical protein
MKSGLLGTSDLILSTPYNQNSHSAVLGFFGGGALESHHPDHHVCNVASQGLTRGGGLKGITSCVTEAGEVQ